MIIYNQMKKDKPLIFKLALILSDVAAVVLSFALAYYVRTHIDLRPYYFNYDIKSYIILGFTLIPLWLIVNFVTGLYDRSVFLYRPKEYGRVFVASIVSIMSMISFEFFTGDDIFPVRIIAVYFVGINFIAMIIGRELIRFFNRVLLRGGVGRQEVLIIGNNERSAEMAEFFDTHDDYGYNIVGIVARSEFLPKKTKSPRHFASFKEAVGKTEPEIIIHTDVARSEEIYNYAISHHLSYMFVPQQDRLLSQLNSVEIIGGLPVIEVKITKLFGAGRIWKRLMDIVLGTLGLIVASPIMIIIMVWMKLTAPKDSIFFRQIRLTRFNKEFKIFKFRSQKAEYDGLTPEEAFKKMGKPSLAKKYRKNGDQLDDDPRVTKLGKFLRASSLDELPQLINVVRGDISLVGPRALIPQEINQYKRKDIILSVRSGLTGLAQVSGRRDINFEERRRLDVYYVQNWSLLLDIQILFKTVFSVIFRKGAK